ncbi:hypothetical protein IE53DRAFT_254762 [Violaceomyces palustris]|uniref:Uncharacterized protein n=1 Tax=Violaceomyces palustris TaxID=1673888 RepID=A0ACD0NNF9_9BASI|nr:hypothetical protein IE53DRAFT_254762 [Violaceomyces palustris]
MDSTTPISISKDQTEPITEAMMSPTHPTSSNQVWPNNIQYQAGSSSPLRRVITPVGAEYEALYLDNKERPSTDFWKQLGNMTALGIAVFAVSNTMIAMILMQFRGVTHTNIYVGQLWFSGGLGSFITAIFELLIGNTFAYTVFGAFTGYYFSIAAVFTPAFGIQAAYPTNEEFFNALSIFYYAYDILFLVFLIASLRTNVVFIWILFFVVLTGALLGASFSKVGEGQLEVAVQLQKASGAMLFIASMAGWYLLAVQLFAANEFNIKLPVGDLTRTGMLQRKAKRDEEAAAATIRSRPQPTSELSVESIKRD